MQQKVACIEYV